MKKQCQRATTACTANAFTLTANLHEWGNQVLVRLPELVRRVSNEANNGLTDTSTTQAGQRSVGGKHCSMYVNRTMGGASP